MFKHDYICHINEVKTRSLICRFFSRALNIAAVDAAGMLQPRLMQRLLDIVPDHVCILEANGKAYGLRIDTEADERGHSIRYLQRRFGRYDQGFRAAPTDTETDMTE